MCAKEWMLRAVYGSISLRVSAAHPPRIMSTISYNFATLVNFMCMCLTNLYWSVWKRTTSATQLYTPTLAYWACIHIWYNGWICSDAKRGSVYIVQWACEGIDYFDAFALCFGCRVLLRLCLDFYVLLGYVFIIPLFWRFMTVRCNELTMCICKYSYLGMFSTYRKYMLLNLSQNQVGPYFSFITKFN